MIFKGHLMALYKQDGARFFRWSQGVPLTNFTHYAKGTTERIANNARKLATDAGRPVISFDHVKTRNRVQQKDDLAQGIAERDGITEGIVCLISAVEPCMSFQVRRRHGPSRSDQGPGKWSTCCGSPKPSMMGRRTDHREETSTHPRADRPQAA